MEAVARGCSRAGVRCNDAVVLCMPDGPEFLPLLLGITRVAACAPVNPALSRAEMESFLTRVGARALIAAPDSEPAGVARSLGIPALDPERIASGEGDLPDMPSAEAPAI